jgi:hypothetical protein
LAPLTKGSKKAEKKIEEDSESVGNMDKFGELQKSIINLKVHPQTVTTPADDKPKTKGSNKASRKATEGVKAKVESKAAGNAPASGEFPTFITSLKVSYLDSHRNNRRQGQSDG